MYFDSDAANFALLLARVWVAIMIFAHDWRHVKAIQSGPGGPPRSRGTQSGGRWSRAA